MKATITGNISGLYIDSRTNTAYIDPNECENIEAVNLDGVNHITARRTEAGKMYIIQISGYNAEKGLFTEIIK